MPLSHSRVIGSILLISAEQPSRQVIGALLETAGHHVHSVETMYHACQCLQHPEFDFDTVIGMLPARDATSDVYSCMVVAYSPHTSLILIGPEPRTNSTSFLREGKAVGWLARPFTHQVLLNMVTVATEHSMRARGSKR